MERVTKSELESFERENRRIDREIAGEDCRTVCLRCGRGFDSGTSGRYTFAANFCGICLIEGLGTEAQDARGGG